MYDPSLEELIDAVIADGVISDKEYKVVVSKAKALGIDEDEIAVYMEGKLDKLKNQMAASQQAKKSNSKVGDVKKCPNCGATLPGFAGKCEECGFELRNIESNSPVKDLVKRLEEIQKKTFLPYSKQAKMKNAIAGFVVPTTKEDMLELLMLCLTNINTNINNEDLVKDAWVAKAQEIKTKAELLFPGDPMFAHSIAEMESTVKKNKNKRKKKLVLIGLIGITSWAILFALPFLRPDDREEKLAEKQQYLEQKIEAINALPTPDDDNYMECYRELIKIKWERERDYSWEDSYKSYAEAYNNYAFLLRKAFLEAGVSEDEMPEIIRNASSDSSSSTSDGVNDEKAAKEAEKYSNKMLKKINDLSMPDEKNYKKCYKKWCEIQWTESKTGVWSEGYEAFEMARASYAGLLVIAFKEAGVEDADIPSDLRKGDSASETDSFDSDDL